MKIEQLRIGQKVTIDSNYKLSEWAAQVVTISGLARDRHGAENISIIDCDGHEYDGFTAEAFYW